MTKMDISPNIIKKLLFEFDLAGLVAFDILAPSDEYDSEAEMIWERISETEEISEESVVPIIEEVMRQSFGNTPKRELYPELAREILGVSKKHLCPVCRKSFFERRRSFDICEECGWEDDEVQSSSLTYEGGANHFSVLESQLVYALQNKPDKRDEADVLIAEYQSNVREYHDGMSSDELKELTRELVTGLLKIFYRGVTSNLDKTAVRRTDEILNYE